MNSKHFQRLLSSIWLGLASAGILVVLVLFHDLVPGYNVYRVLELDLADLSLLILMLLVAFFFARFGERVVLDNTELKDLDFPMILDLSLGQVVAMVGYSLFSLGIESLFIPVISMAVFGTVRIVTHFTQSDNVRAAVRMGMVAILTGGLIFFLHESKNEGLHLSYAKTLASKNDASESLIFKQFAKLASDEKEGKDPRAFWEARFLSFPYLAANYGLSFRQNSAHPTKNHQVIGAYVDESRLPTFSIKTPTENLIELRQAANLRHSLYVEDSPYRGLDKLDNFEFAVVERGRIVMSNTHAFDENILELDLPQVGTAQKIEGGNFDALIYNAGDGRYAILGEPLPEFVVVFSNCCFFFSILIGIHLLYGLFIRVGSKNFRTERWKRTPLESRLQVLVLGTTLLLFVVISGSTFFFLAENNAKSTQERQLAIAKEIRTNLQQIEIASEHGGSIEPSDLRACFKEEVTDIEVYSANGNLLVSSLATLENAKAPKEIPQEILKLLLENPQAVKIEPFSASSDLRFRIYLAVKVSSGEMLALAINTSSLVTGTSQDIPVIMSKMLNVYVVLLLFSWLSSVILIKMLTRPLQQVSDKLKNFRLGEKPERIDWPSEDAIGQLSEAYNLMAQQVEARSQEIVKQEREGAWQVMAQQIAHEINNSLTPLRLNTQYIAMAMNRVDDSGLDGAKKMTGIMVEKIDHLSSVASQFGLFAQLDKPSISNVSILPLIENFKATIEPRITTKVDLLVNQIPESLEVSVDPAHLLTVLNKLVKNADSALMNQVDSKIELVISSAYDQVEICVRDNGPGIPREIQQKIFDPTFETNTSTTGLGLPIAWRIIQFFGGKLSFTTSEKGTCFKISLPLVNATELVPTFERSLS